jgi:DNA-directed RNA polymerase specialized sigma24 family protein
MEISKPPSVMDDEAIRVRLMESNPIEQDRGFTDLYNHARRPLAEMLLDRFRALSSEDHAEIITKTFLDLHRSLKKNTVDLERPLAPLLFTIAARRAKDVLRAKSSQKRSHVDFYADVSDVLSRENYSQEWRSFVSAGKSQEILDGFHQFIPSLSRLQLYVAQAIAHSLPDCPTNDELCDEVERLCGRRYSILSVKEARSEVSKKFRQFLPTS